MTVVGTSPVPSAVSWYLLRNSFFPQPCLGLSESPWWPLGPQKEVDYAMARARACSGCRSLSLMLSLTRGRSCVGGDRRLATCAPCIAWCWDAQQQAQEPRKLQVPPCLHHVWRIRCDLCSQCSTVLFPSCVWGCSELIQICCSLFSFYFWLLFVPQSLPRAGGGFGSPVAMGKRGWICSWRWLPVQSSSCCSAISIQIKLFFIARGQTSFLFIISLIKHYSLRTPAHISGSK